MAGVKGKSGRKANEQVFRHALLQKLDELDPTTGRKGVFRIAEKLVKLAEDGDLGAIREVMDRVDGKPKQAIEASGPNGGPIETKETGAGIKALSDFVNSIAERSREAGEPE